MNYEPNLKSTRAKKARLANKFGPALYRLVQVSAFIITFFGTAIYLAGSESQQRIAFICLSVGLGMAILAFWYKGDLSNLKTSLNSQKFEDILNQKLLGNLKNPLTPKSLWNSALKGWQAVFICNHLLLHPNDIETMIDDNPANLELIWKLSDELKNKFESPEIHSGTLATAIILSSPAIIASLTKQNINEEEVIETLGWLERRLKYEHQPKPSYGGIGRDWATGFTPTLNRYSQNISQDIERGRGHYHFLSQSDATDSILYSLSQSSGGVAIVGESGSGKTSLVFSIAQRLLKGEHQQLSYYQIVSLNASAILSSDKSQLEKLMLTIFSEAVRAKNIILFLDDAKLFFGEGLGAFDMSQILQPILSNGNLKIVASFTPGDYQKLKTTNESLANGFTAINLSEPPEDDTKKILEDSALTLEQKTGVMVSFEAVREAYRLSALYMQDRAYPGKAISLLDQAVPYAEQKIMTGLSVQKAIEKSKGVRVSQAEGAEVDVLLNLEDKIHQRMINQSRAVDVVSSALRRGRAGVNDQQRPIGSFLFLGPTGVGKTELARSLASVYFGDEKQMVRLDMSEYQQAGDVDRILSDGTSEKSSLILSVREQPFSVVLLDEIEKAHPNILNLLLQLLDEGHLTDSRGKQVSFSNTIIITTSNAGSADISKHVAEGNNLDDFERPLIDKLIGDGQFRAELINRFDEVVLFRPLTKEESKQVASLILAGINKTLSNQNISVQLTDQAFEKIVTAGYDPQFGARPMRRVMQKAVQDEVATKILQKQAGPGSTITIDLADLPKLD